MSQKAIKVFHNGERLKDIYPFATKREMLKFRVRQAYIWTRNVVAIGAVVFAVSGVAFLTGASHTTIVSADTQTKLESKTAQLQSEVIAQLEACESNSATTADGIVRIDDNHKGTLPVKDKLSYGVLQFKVSTIQSYEQSINKKTLSNHDAILLALDNSQAEALAKQIIFQTTGGLWNWSCATQAMGTKVEVIKELTK